MRIFDIALWLLVFNLTLSALNTTDVFGAQIQVGMNLPDYAGTQQTVEQAIRIDVSSPINSFISLLIYTVMSVPYLIGAISFSVAGLPSVVKIIFGALGGEGGAAAGAFIAGILAALTAFIYILGLIEFATGKYIGDR